MSIRSYPRLYFELIFIGFTIMMGMSLSSSFLPLLAKDLDPSGFLVGLVTSSWFVSRIFFELPAGIISDRIGRRTLFVMGVGLSAFGAFLCTQATSIYILILGRAIWGLGAALFFMNNTALVIDLFESKERGQALGIFNGVEFTGSFIGAPIGAFVVKIVGSYTGVFYVTFFLVLTSFAAALTSRSFKEFKGRQAATANLSIKQNFESLRDKGITILCTCNFLNSLIMSGIFATVLSLYLNKELLFPIEYIGVFLSFRTAGQIITTLGSGALFKRFSRRKVVVIGYLLSAGCLLIFTFISSLEMILIIGFIEGFGEGFISTGLIVLLSDAINPAARGGAIGLYRTFMDVGGFVGPVAFMFIYTIMDSHSAFFTSFGIIVLSAVLLISWLYRKKQNPNLLP
ncbi:MAG: hypothetical protein QG670_773 [Thermoproteota archaeon]|nr:hypothetical protein [Thermoproteota archaeon]